MSDRRAFFRELAQAAVAPRTGAGGAVPATPPEPAPEPDRYAGQVAAAGWDAAAQRRLRAAAVLVVGAGPLGSPVALALAGAGVGRLGVVDPGDVGLGDLRAAPLHFTPDAGVPRAHSAAAKLGFLNPDVQVEPYQAPFSAAMLSDQDVVVAADGAGLAVHDACVRAGVPVVVGTLAGLGGSLLTVRPGETACARCAGLADADAEPVLGPVAGVVASLMALEALRLAGAADPAPGGVLVEVDLAAPALTRTAVAPEPGCRLCARVP